MIHQENVFLMSLLTFLKKYKLDSNDVRGQDYDNESNMKDKNQGAN